MSVFDAAIVEEAFGDDHPSLGAFLRSVRASLGAHCERVREAIHAGDADAVRKAAHALRGSSGHVGGSRLAKIAERFEMLARDGSIAPKAELEDLDRELGELQRAIDAYVGRLGP